MSKFERKLSGDRMERLRRLADAPGANWWKDLLEKWRLPGQASGDDGLRLAVRANYLNFYRRGQSVARVGFDSGGHPYSDVHVKYLLAPDRIGKDGPSLVDPDSYARIQGESFRVKPRSGPEFAVTKPLKAIIAASEAWTGREKYMVDRIVAETQSVLDLEIALPRAMGEEDGAPRMDLAALEEDRSHKQIRLVFWEAKLIDDDRLRASDPEKAEVNAQLGTYERYMGSDLPGKNFANEYRRNVTDEYRRCCQLIVELGRMAGRDAVLSALIQRVAAGEDFSVDPSPRLVLLEGESQRRLERCEVKRGARWDVYGDALAKKWKTHYVASGGYSLA